MKSKKKTYTSTEWAHQSSFAQTSTLEAPFDNRGTYRLMHMQKRTVIWTVIISYTVTKTMQDADCDFEGFVLPGI